MSQSNSIKRVSIKAVSFLAALLALASLVVAPYASAILGTSELYFKDGAVTLFGSSVEIIATNQMAGSQLVTATTTIVNTASSVRDVTCSLIFNDSVDVARTTLPAGSTAAPTRARITAQVLATPAQSGSQAQAHFLCNIIGTTGGVTATVTKVSMDGQTSIARIAR